MKCTLCFGVVAGEDVVGVLGQVEGDLVNLDNVDLIGEVCSVVRGDLDLREQLLRLRIEPFFATAEPFLSSESLSGVKLEQILFQHWQQ